MSDARNVYIVFNGDEAIAVFSTEAAADAFAAQWHARQWWADLRVESFALDAASELPPQEPPRKAPSETSETLTRISTSFGPPPLIDVQPW